MGFSERDKLKALAIVHIFETSKPLGDYSAVAVLNDGAGISYGINQFTHKSGALAAVVRRWLNLRLQPDSIWFDYLEALNDRSKASIRLLSGDTKLKQWLRELGETDEMMQQAQREIAFEKYLRPAIEACDGSGFTLPLSLAVIYDSINHGSYEKIRDRVVIDVPGNGSMTPEEFEKEWISEYVKKRDAWLESIPRLKSTDYRTDFFLAQIARGNWNLDLPLNVHGYRLTEKDLIIAENTREPLQTAELRPNPPEIQPETSQSGEHREQAVTPAAEAPFISSGQLPVAIGQPEFIPEDKTADAPPPTGFLNKLKTHLAGIFAFIGGGAGVKEWLGIQFTPETVQLLTVAIPTVLGLGFLGFMTWYIAEKIIGFKTLKLQSEINTDPNRHNLKINPQ